MELMLVLDRVVLGKTRVRYRNCGTCPEATVVTVADGQVGILPDGRSLTYADPSALDTIESE